MALLKVKDINDIKQISLLTAESFLISHSYNNGRLEIVVETDDYNLKISIHSPIVFFGDIDEDKINNIGTIYFREINGLLGVDDNGYFIVKEGKNEVHKLFRNKAKIALGYKYKEFSHLGYFLGSSIKNAFLVGQSNMETLSISRVY